MYLFAIFVNLFVYPKKKYSFKNSHPPPFIPFYGFFYDFLNKKSCKNDSTRNKSYKFVFLIYEINFTNLYS